MFDLILRNGTVVDGTGAAAFSADVGVKDGVITHVGASLEGQLANTREVIDASGHTITPGFVDVHTHYDGQVTWDSLLEPSSAHGVTTVITGNCGVGFAPVRPGSQAWLVQLMEGVEDIPGTALHEGISWDWESFPEYLDAIEPRNWSMDVGAFLPHGALRGYVMGERGAANENAASDDNTQMARLVREAIEAGAFGFSSSRTVGHKAADGRPVPGTYAAFDELTAIARAVVEGGGGLLEFAPAMLEGGGPQPVEEVEMMPGYPAIPDCSPRSCCCKTGQAPPCGALSSMPWQSPMPQVRACWHKLLVVRLVSWLVLARIIRSNADQHLSSYLRAYHSPNC